MTDYSKMSDKEINHSVLAIFEPDIEHMMLGGNETHFYHCGITGDGYHQIDIPDYCNNPSDAWPIITEMRPNIIPERSKSGKWSIGVNTGKTLHEIDRKENNFTYIDANLLRGCMIVFLMMKDAEKC